MSFSFFMRVCVCVCLRWKSKTLKWKDRQRRRRKWRWFLAERHTVGSRLFSPCPMPLECSVVVWTPIRPLFVFGGWGPAECNRALTPEAISSRGNNTFILHDAFYSHPHGVSGHKQSKRSSWRCCTPSHDALITITLTLRQVPAQCLPRLNEVWFLIWKWALHIIKLRGDPEFDTPQWLTPVLFIMLMSERCTFLP